MGDDDEEDDDDEEEEEDDDFSCGVYSNRIIFEFPFGTEITQTIPIGFDLASSDFPFEIKLPDPVLQVIFKFVLRLGFDASQGLVLDTAPACESEISIEAQLSVEDAGFEGNFILFDTAITDINLAVAAGIFIDMNKDAALRSSEPDEDGIMTFGQVASNFPSLFELSGRAAATLTTGDLTVDEATDEYYGITFGVGSVFKDLGLSEADQTKLSNLIRKSEREMILFRIVAIYRHLYHILSFRLSFQLLSQLMLQLISRKTSSLANQRKWKRGPTQPMQ